VTPIGEGRSAKPSLATGSSCVRKPISKALTADALLARPSPRVPAPADAGSYPRLAIVAHPLALGLSAAFRPYVPFSARLLVLDGLLSLSPSSTGCSRPPRFYRRRADAAVVTHHRSPGEVVWRDNSTRLAACARDRRRTRAVAAAGYAPGEQLVPCQASLRVCTPLSSRRAAGRYHAARDRRGGSWVDRSDLRPGKGGAHVPATLRVHPPFRSKDEPSSAINKAAWLENRSSGPATLPVCGREFESLRE